MASLYKRTGSPFYWASITDESGTRRLVSTKTTTAKEAKAFLARMVAATADRRKAGETLQERFVEIIRRATLDASRGLLNPSKVRAYVHSALEAATGERGHEPTVAEWLGTWAAETGQRWKESTRQNMQRQIRAWVEALGKAADLPLSELSFDHIRPALESFTGDRKGKLATLRGALGYAVARKRIESSPASTRALRADTVARLPAGTFAEEELDRIQAAASGEWVGVIAVARATGMRLGDCRALRWDECRFDVMAIRRKQEKTGAWLDAPMGRAAEWLLAHRKRSGPVFPELAALRKETASMQFGATMKRAKVPTTSDASGRPERRSFHSIRHSVVSSLMAAGIDPRVARTITGHASEKMHAHYSHATPADRQEAARKAGL